MWQFYQKTRFPRGNRLSHQNVNQNWLFLLMFNVFNHPPPFVPLSINIYNIVRPNRPNAFRADPYTVIHAFLESLAEYP